MRLTARRDETIDGHAGCESEDRGRDDCAKAEARLRFDFGIERGVQARCRHRLECEGEIARRLKPLRRLLLQTTAYDAIDGG